MQHEGVDVLSCEALAQGNSAFYMNVGSNYDIIMMVMIVIMMVITMIIIMIIMMIKNLKK